MFKKDGSAPGGDVTSDSKAANKPQFFSGRRIILVSITVLVIVMAGLFVWKKFLLPKPEHPVVVEMRSRIPELKERAAETPDQAGPRFELGSAYYASGDKQAALVEYEAAVERDPSVAMYHNSLGNTYRDLKRNEEAIACYQRAIELDPKTSTSYINLANLQLYVLDDAKAAIATYDKALGVMDDPLDLMLLKGVALEQKGDVAMAKQLYEEILQKKPDHAPAKASLERLNK